MKKLSEKHKKHLVRASEREMDKRIRKNTKRNRLNKSRLGYYVLCSPGVLSLMRRQSRSRLIAFTRSIHKLVNKGKRRIWLDFSDLNEVVADGMIYLHAELSRLSRVVKGLQFRSSPPSNKTVGQVFNQIGFSKVINCKIGVSPECNRKDVSTWLCAYGEKVVGEKCGGILDYYQGRMADSLTRELFRGMTEAMTNSYHHAYIKERGDSLRHIDYYKPWWLFSQEVDGKLSVVLCDLGLGIPGTIPINNPGLMRKLKRFFGKDLTDSVTIKEAIVNSKTRTHKAYRGKGLRQIVETINNSEDGKISILSNKGCYTHTESGETNLTDYPASIGGTIICWQVSLPVESVDVNAFSDDEAVLY
ncbi:hypothetical protein F0A17_13690 [Billgrantia pellis]|uniref:ATP-binding protein n=1 Tax=Billgrantia pellis TaxID=2606936 RepID=A0A7V7FY54_9GAMM|nr:hypothetical protein [Halomonas pellis]KAA0011174.1 hypothetical protein F0A17_13690 [Halomonas pellis]